MVVSLKRKLGVSLIQIKALRCISGLISVLPDLVRRKPRTSDGQDGRDQMSAGGVNGKVNAWLRQPVTFHY
jgi:hypothetical protein